MSSWKKQLPEAQCSFRNIEEVENSQIVSMGTMPWQPIHSTQVPISKNTPIALNDVRSGNKGPYARMQHSNFDRDR